MLLNAKKSGFRHESVELVASNTPLFALAIAQMTSLLVT